MKKIAIILSMVALLGAGRVVHASNADLSEWSFSTDSNFSDSGVNGDGQRDIRMSFPVTTGDYGQISNTATGLTNGLNTFEVSVSAGPATFCYNADYIQLYVDNNLLEQWIIDGACSPALHTFSVKTNVSGNQADVVLRVVARSLGGGGGGDYRFYNFSATPTSTSVNINTASLPSVEMGVNYSEDIQVSGGYSPYTWSVYSGSLPAGLTLNSSTGNISGVPTASGLSSFVVRVVDSTSDISYQNLTLRVTPSPAVTTVTVPGGEVGVAYSSTVNAVNGTAPYTWSISSGALPSGLSINSSTGDISGAPTIAGDYSFTVRATDTNNQYGEQPLSISVTAPLRDWVFGTDSNFSDSGVSDGKRVVHMSFPVTTGDYGQISNTVTGLTNGLNTFEVSVSAGPATGCYNADYIQLYADNNLLEQWIIDGACSPVLHTFSVKTNVSGNQADIVLRVVARTLGGGGGGDYRFYNFSATPISTAVNINTASLPSVEMGVNYSENIQVSGGTAPYTWNIYSGSLPSGLTLNSNGNLSGIPTASGLFSFVVRAVDSNTEISYQNLTLRVTPSPAVTTTIVPGAELNVAYSSTLSAVNGLLPYVWSISSGALPSGLSINSSTGDISGIPNTVGVYSFTAKATDANNQYGEQFLTLSVTIPLSDWTFGASAGDFSDFGVAEGKRVVHMSFPVTTGDYGQLSKTITGLANGLDTFEVSVSAGPATGCYNADYIQMYVDNNLLEQWTIDIACGPTLHTFSVGANISNNQADVILRIVGKNLGGAGSGDYRFYNLNIIPASPTITTTTLNVGTVSGAYSQSIQATDGLGPYSWSILSGSLAPGLSLNSSTGAISGTPTTAGTYNFTVKVTDANSSIDTQALSLIINSAPAVTTTSLSGGTIGGAYSKTLQSTGGTTPLVWSVISGTLPAGLSLNASTGVISGTTTAVGTSNFTVRVTDTNAVSGSKALSIIVNAAPVISTSSPLAQATNGGAYSQALAATGGTTPLSWTISAGSLPSGLSLSSAGVVSGTPTATGTFNFTAQVTDSNSVSNTKAFSLVVNVAPSIVTTSLAGATVTGAYSKTLLASGGTAPLTWSVISGTLPAGLSLNSSTGVISGTPTAVGTSNFTVRVTDANSVTASQALSIVVNAAPVITTTTLPNGKRGVAYSQTLAATGGTNPRTWSVSAGALPAGLSLDASTGVISGTPTTRQTASFTILITDVNGVSDTQALTLRIM